VSSSVTVSKQEQRPDETRCRGSSTRVVVTGLGVITPIGIGKEAFWDNLVNGVSGIGPITRFDASDYPTRIAGEVHDFDPTEFIDKRDARRMDRYAQFAVAAAKMAIEDAELDISSVDPGRVAVVVGSGIGGIETFVAEFEKLYVLGPTRVSPVFIPMMISNMAAGQISIICGVKGPNLSVATACATSSHAIGDAARIIRSGEADVAIAGGSEAAVVSLGIAGFCANRALSTRNDAPEQASCPFDKRRDGFVMSEGAGILILESLEHAKARGAQIYAELAGFGMTADAYHIVAPDPTGDGAASAIHTALSMAGLNPEDVDYVNAHGTSTPLGDKAETKAIRVAFGEHADRLKVSSNKSMIGHMLGAAGAVEAVATVMTVKEQIIPPTINYMEPDPECDLDYVPNHAVKAEVRAAISNSFGFGGHNSVLAFRRVE
jgi:3-oxoacyl-[acyl-carrier-protein] synthase II